MDGAAWSAQFAGWSAAQWVLLVTTGTVVYLGGNFLLQARREREREGGGLLGPAATWHRALAQPNRPRRARPTTRLQNATWALGAPLVAMLYGLRVVAAIAEQQVILGTTVLAAQPALQASGVCLAVVSVSLYMYAAWRRSRQGQAL